MNAKKQIKVRVYKDYTFDSKIFKPYCYDDRGLIESIAIEMAQMILEDEICARTVNFNNECVFKILNEE